MSSQYLSRAHAVSAAPLVRRRVTVTLIGAASVLVVLLGRTARAEALTPGPVGTGATEILETHAAPARSTEPSTQIVPSDNRRPAGHLENGVLTVRLEARNGTWHPEGPSGLGLPVAAFAEEGKAPQNPGPLVRVRAGTEVRAFVRNSLTKPLTLFGLGKQRGITADSFVVEPGAVREVRFRAADPGTY